MPIRYSLVDAAAARAERQLAESIGNLVLARRSANLAQAAVATELGVSRSILAAWEQRRVDPRLDQLSRWGAVVGLDVSLRTFPAADPLRDVGQLRLLERFARLVGDGWEWRSEVPVSTDPRDRRAFDAVIRRNTSEAAVEAVVRLVDAQGQVRPILAKQLTSGIGTVVLVLADTRHNHLAVTAGAATLGSAFPIGSRPALASLRRGLPPEANAIVFA